MSVTPGVSAEGPIARYEQSVIDRVADFKDPHQEWRRLFSELFGTFLLVLVAAGGGMMGHAFPGVITRTDAVVTPALMVMGVILFMGKVSGAPSEPCGQYRVRAAPRLPVVARARLHHRPARRCDVGRVVPARDHQRVGHLRIELSDRRILG